MGVWLPSVQLPGSGILTSLGDRAGGTEADTNRVALSLFLLREPSSPLCWPPGTSPVGGGASVPCTPCTGLLDSITLLGSWVSTETGLQKILELGLALPPRSAGIKERGEVKS